MEICFFSKKNNRIKKKKIYIGFSRLLLQETDDSYVKDQILHPLKSIAF